MKTRRVALTDELECTLGTPVGASPVSAEFEADEQVDFSAEIDLPAPGDCFDNHLRNAMFYAKEGDSESLEAVLRSWGWSLAVYGVREIVNAEFRRLRMVKLHVALKELRLIGLTDEQIAEECGVTVRTVEKNRAQIGDMVPPITQKFG